MDQAQKLREIIAKPSIKKLDKEKFDSNIIAITSGKGGVGKTNFTVNLAIALSQMGKKVSIIDADLGLANIDVVMGIVPKYTLSSVIKGDKKIQEIVTITSEGIKVVSGGSGVRDLVNLKEEEIEKLIKSLSVLNEESDYILIDTGAGIGDSVLSFIKSASDVILIVTPDPSSITDAYAVVKNIFNYENNVKVVVNRVDSNKEGQEVFEKINRASLKFLNKPLENIGYIYEDSSVKKSSIIQKPFILNTPNSLASKGIGLIAYNLVNNSKLVPAVNGFNKFINKLFKNF
ncbi:MinD/ParA family protein [Helicovermis profundi]|uniref:MinD/ParA family protein n=1 Tax=Helicovermis profundi TaxID=3065157 RepID=A0AAU9EIG3_9FIRM|nr:MinD/ParA family protein [Clostridia bacterium S502]